jgi:peptidoglycan/xylan/chitin deacetylase (PgdA/CDA1 family)
VTAPFTLAAGLGRAVGGVLDGLGPARLSVLIFHRVLPRPDPLFPEEPCAERFEGLMRAVAAGFEVLPLGRAYALWSRGELPRRALTITFDDGYADNAEVALPILRRLDIPATFFIATGFLDGGRMWNDSVIECIRGCRLERVDLGAFGLGEQVLGDVASRRRLIDQVLPHIKYASLSAREQALSALHEACGRPPLPADLMMTTAQVQALHAAGMEIGGHTVHHPILTELSDDEAEHEIATGRARLQQITCAPVDVFAYPNGKPGRDYGPQHVAMVRRLGFACAVSTAPGVVRAESAAHEWPRFTPWDRVPAAWMARLLLNRYRG